jgi:hypothetical protein
MLQPRLSNKFPRSVVRRWLYFSLATGLVWLVFFALISILPVLSGDGSYSQTFRMTVNHWFPWVLLSPLVVWLSFRFPVERNGWPWRVLAHLAAAAIFAGVGAWLSLVAFPNPRPFDRLGGRMEFERRMPPFPAPGDDRDGRGPPPDFGGGGPPQFGRTRHEPPFWLRISFNLPIYLTMASLCHTFIYFRRTQQRERRALELETQLGQARLQALRMQLQPHFLFNTLNAISTLVQTNPMAAQEMIASLGQMLRLSLDNAPQPEVRVEDEMKFLNCYLEIAQMRFGDRLEVKFDVAPETAEALVPTFILQPLVENAIRHGIEPGPARGTIKISVRKSGDQLLIAIRDTGGGLAEEAGASRQPAGIGIANTKARLETLYAGRHYFVVRNSATGGCVAELEIPFHTTAAPPAGAAQPHPIP